MMIESIDGSIAMTYKLDNRKHIKFLRRHLDLLPSNHQENDPNKMAIVFYSLVGLATLGEDVSQDYEGSLDWLHRHYTVIQAPDSTHLISGFTGTLSMTISSVSSLSLPNTLFSLLINRVLKDDHFFNQVLDRQSLARFVGLCQDPKEGSFKSTLDYKKFLPSPVDAGDLRFCYVAVAILHLIGSSTESDFNKSIDVGKLIQYILSQQCSAGGFGSYDEPHAGYTSCALSTLCLLGKLNTLSDSFKEKTISWLLSRQVSNQGCMCLQEDNECFDLEDHGGFQGRENKFADTCYAFWCLNSLQILTPDFELLVQGDLIKEFLLNRTQNSVVGGFSKNDQDDPDLYHTCLGIAALATLNRSFNGLLFIPEGIKI